MIVKLGYCLRFLYNEGRLLVAAAQHTPYLCFANPKSRLLAYTGIIYGAAPASYRCALRPPLFHSFLGGRYRPLLCNNGRKHSFTASNQRHAGRNHIRYGALSPGWSIHGTEQLPAHPTGLQ